MKRARKKNQSVKAPVIKKSPKVKKSKKGKKNKRAKIFVTVLVCIVVLAAIGLGLGGGGDNALVPIDTSTGKMNVLLLGVDEAGLRTDAIMVASYDFDNESLKLLSVPRDTKVYVTNRKVTRKINEVHAMSKKGASGGIMGPLASVEAVSTLTGIPINYYVEFSFDAIDEIMDILGPVSFDVPDVEGGGKGMNYDDPTQNLHIHLKPGLQELSGNQVQQFLRYRKSNNNTVDGSDTSRVQRQQEFVKALIDQKVNMSLIVKAGDIYSQVKKNIKTNFSAGEIAKYSTHLLNLQQENITTYSLPGADKHTTAWYFECDLDATKTLIETEFGYDASDITNKMEITGEKYKASKASKTESPDKTKDSGSDSDTSKKTASPKKTSQPIKDTDDEQVKVTAKPTEKPKKTAEPVEEPAETERPKKTHEPIKEPAEETETPKKTAEPARPTAKPTQEPKDNEVQVIED